MKDAIATVYGGENARSGDFLVNRLLPGRNTGPVGPFVFLDHIYPKRLATIGETLPTGDFAHPHRGVATFNYVFSGMLTHYDSRGNRHTAGAGGVQWMKAGNGIIHDEQAFVNDRSAPIFHSLQCWINLPSQVKQEDPCFMAIEAAAVPFLILPQDIGILRVLLGSCGVAASPIPVFANEFIYHLQLAPKSRFTISIKEGLEYGVFVPDGEVLVNDRSLSKSKIVIFGDETQTIGLLNPDVDFTDVLIFGGSPISEQIIAEGPFVMNDRNEIAVAYRDFFDGKYGGINYAAPYSPYDD